MVPFFIHLVLFLNEPSFNPILAFLRFRKEKMSGKSPTALPNVDSEKFVQLFQIFQGEENAATFGDDPMSMKAVPEWISLRGRSADTVKSTALQEKFKEVHVSVSQGLCAARAWHGRGSSGDGRLVAVQSVRKEARSNCKGFPYWVP